MPQTWFPQVPPQDATDLTTDNDRGQVQTSTDETYEDRFLSTFEHGPIGVVVHGVQGIVASHDGSTMLSQQDAKEKHGLGGLVDFDGPVTEDYAQLKSGQAARDWNYNDVLSRGGPEGAANTWMGYGLSMSANFLDPIQDAISLVPTARLMGLAGKFGDGTAAALAEHSVSGTVNNAAFSVATEPFTYLDDPKDWSVEGAAERMIQNGLFGAVAGPLLHTTGAALSAALRGPLTDAEGLANGKQAGLWDTFISRLQPETKATLAKTALGRSLDGKDNGAIQDAVGLDQRILQHEASLGGVELPMEERAAVLEKMDEATPEVAKLPWNAELPQVPKDAPVAPATYLGDMQTHLGAIPLYNLTEAIDGHVAGSTVSHMTLLNKGYNLPEKNVTAVDPKQLESQRVEAIRQKAQAEQRAEANPPRMQFGRNMDMPNSSLEKQASDLQEMLAEHEKEPAPTKEGEEPAQTPTQKILAEHEQFSNAYKEGVGCVTKTL